MLYKMLVVSDIHGAISNVRALRGVEFDIAVIAGDLADGDMDKAISILGEFTRHTSNVVWVPGNTDDPRLLELDRVGINIHGKLVRVDEFVFVGVGGSLYTPFNTPIEYSEEELRMMLHQSLKNYERKSSSDRLVIVSHTPPYMSGLDRIRGGAYVGSKVLREILAEYKPLLLATGHIHESWGVSSVEGVPSVNPGPLASGRYSVIEVDKDGWVMRIRLYKV